MKRIAIAILVFISVVWNVAGSGNQDLTAWDMKDFRVTFVSPYIGHPYWDTVSEAVFESAVELAIDVRETGPVGGLNTEKQIEAIEMAIAAKVDGILTMALDPELFTPVINKAVDRGIPVVLIDTDAPDSNRNAYAGTSNYYAGYKAGIALIKAVGTEGKVGIITGAANAENLNLRIDGFREALAGQSSLVVADIREGDSNRIMQREDAFGMLTDHPDLVGVFGTDATAAVAVAEAVSEIRPGMDLAIIGFDDMEETLEGIRKGVITASVVQRNDLMGSIGMELLRKLHDGEAIESRIVDTGVVIVTDENVNRVLTQD